MVRVTIDNQTVEVTDGSTILQAAQSLGIEIPTLCYSEHCRPQNSCMVCLVKLLAADGHGKFVPSCATKITDGMVVESETPEVRDLRRQALELLLGDHLGDCEAPCRLAHKTFMNIPAMIRAVAAGNVTAAAKIIRQHIALPASMSYADSPRFENACRRARYDQPVAIGQLIRTVILHSLAGTNQTIHAPTIPPRSDDSIAIVGGGPTGLAAAYYLSRAGHWCTIYEARDALGGRLRAEKAVPAHILQKEILHILATNIKTKHGQVINAEQLATLREKHAAVLLATGEAGLNSSTLLRDVSAKGDKIVVTKGTYQVEGQRGLFAAGGIVKPSKQLADALANGYQAARIMGQFLCGESLSAWARPLTTTISDPTLMDLPAMVAQASNAARQQPIAETEPLSGDQAIAEAKRCLRCDCRKAESCQLRRWASDYHAKPTATKQSHRVWQIQTGATLRFEPGKCIQCGLCGELMQQAELADGFTFQGRGYDVAVTAPLGRSLGQLAITPELADRCVSACPTAALTRME